MGEIRDELKYQWYTWRHGDNSEAPAIVIIALCLLVLFGLPLLAS